MELKKTWECGWKRYRNSIKVEQIRSLAGALVAGGMAQGMFVTTSVFQSGAAALQQRLSLRGYRIELMDASRFYSELKLASRQKAPEEFDVESLLSKMHVLISGKRHR